MPEALLSIEKMQKIVYEHRLYATLYSFCGRRAVAIQTAQTCTSIFAVGRICANEIFPGHVASEMLSYSCLKPRKRPLYASRGKSLLFGELAFHVLCLEAVKVFV